MDLRELEACYAHEVHAATARFVHASSPAQALSQLTAAPCSYNLVEALSLDALSVSSVRECVKEAHAAAKLLAVDVSLPSHFGCSALELGADISLERLYLPNRVHELQPIYALAVHKRAFTTATFDLLPSAIELDSAEFDEFSCALQNLSHTMQTRFDHARALAEYLSCCEDLACVSYPGLDTHPFHRMAEQTLMHGFGSLLDFEIPAYWGVSAQDFIDKTGLDTCLNMVESAHTSSSTRLSTPHGAEAFAIRIFAGLDNPLTIADSLDQAMRWFRNPPEP